MKTAGEWLLIFDNTIENKSDLFTGSKEVLYSNTERKFSRLGFATAHRRNFLISGKYEFIMDYPNDNQTYHWTQTVFPTLAKPSQENGFIGIDPQSAPNNWHGLALSNSSATMLDGSPFRSTWFYPIGQYNYYAPNGNINYCIPNTQSGHICVSRVLLWIKLNIYSLDHTCHRKLRYNSFSLLNMLMIINVKS